ncbi:MAG: thiol-disulfide oxidoreductase DCC family protein [Ilumatobacteraceae bacterium]
MTVSTERAMWALPLLVIDGDCAFCQATAARASRAIRRFPISVSWQELERAGLLAGGQGVGPGDGAAQSDVAAALGMLTTDECVRAVQYIDRTGRLHAAHDAVAAVLRDAGRGWWLLGTALRAPGVRQVGAVTYRWVARNRYRLPGGSDRCSLSSAASSSSDR